MGPGTRDLPWASALHSVITACQASAVSASSSSSSSSSSETSSLSPPKPSPSTSHQTGTAATTAMTDKHHHGAMTYPFLTPALYTKPASAGPAARPSAEALVAIPFSVPNVRKLVALLVSNIVEHGKAKMPHRHFSIMAVNMHATWLPMVGRRAVNGVSRYITGNAMTTIFSQIKTPYFRARGGNTKNCTNMPSRRLAWEKCGPQIRAILTYDAVASRHQSNLKMVQAKSTGEFERKLIGCAIR